jgi:hypothetical protein
MMKLVNLLAVSNFTRLMNLPCPLQSAKIFLSLYWTAVMSLLRAGHTRTAEYKCKANFSLFLRSGTIMNNLGLELY